MNANIEFALGMKVIKYEKKGKEKNRRISKVEYPLSRCESILFRIIT